MKIKKIFAAILACTFICKASFVTEVSYRSDSFITASAATEESGTLGANITWKLDDEGTLTISGKGNMMDWVNNGLSYVAYSPWYRNENIINKLDKQ